jgi:hypothetical protein
MGRLVAGSVVLAVVLVGGILLLRAGTMTVHTVMAADSRLVVDGNARSRDAADRAETLTRALVNQCVAETADRSAVRELTWRGDGHFSAVVVPALDEPDRRQLDGCLSDFRMPRLLVSVDGMHVVR